MNFLSKLILPICLVAFSALGGQTIEPTSVTLTYGDSSISAEIGKDKKFAIIRNNDDEKLEFSGSVTKEYTDYIVDVLVIKDSKSNQSSSELKTTILVTKEQFDTLILIGGTNSEMLNITLK